MKNNETGEFELVLGNKQLLSGFAIVVILFGVFFTMGYIVGRNSTPPGRGPETASTALPGDSKQPSAAGAPVPQPPAAATQESGKPTETAAAPAAAETTPATQPVQEPAQATQPAPVTPPPPAPKQEPSLQTGASYLQVSAVARPEAEVVMNTLKNKGFPVLIAPSPKEGLFRVLVGPYRDAGSLGKAKAELEALQFKPWVQK